MATIVYITGGARSGKSGFAEKQASNYNRVHYIATAVCSDDEMASRINRHQQQRPASWKTVEEPYQPYFFINNDDQPEAILLDCLSVWVSNLLLLNWDDEKGFLCPKDELVTGVLQELESLISATTLYQGTLIIVSNEVGSGIVPISPLARYYRDCLGFCNQRIAAIADQAYWCVSGIPVLLKGDNNEK